MSSILFAISLPRGCKRSGKEADGEDRKKIHRKQIFVQIGNGRFRQKAPRLKKNNALSQKTARKQRIITLPETRKDAVFAGTAYFCMTPHHVTDDM